MSKTAASQVISLPTGGGAISGIGETFAPDLHTGTGNFTVPIALPAGRNSFQPELNLVYSTGNGNGPFGLGWSLSIPGVSRKTAKGVPRYDDSRDVFILSGAEDLVPVSVEDSHIRYQPRTEGLFGRITHHASDADDHWEVRSKDGLVSFYGTPGTIGTDPAVVTDPDDRDHIFAWMLSRTDDTFGNQIAYDYERDMGEDGPRRWDQRYLKRIQYVDYGDESTDESQFLVSVTFDYGATDDERPDPFSTYRSGFEIRTRRRCRRIVVATHAGDERIVRTYELRYLDERVAMGELPAATLPANSVSLLSQIRVVGHDGEQVEMLPALEFGYTQFAPEKRHFFPLAGGELPPQSLAAPDTELVDIFGNGLPDILELNGTARYWRNLGDGQFDLPRAMRDAPAGLGLADQGVQLLDADGDGRVDLLATVNGLSGYFPLRFDGRWDSRSFQHYAMAPSFNLKDPEVQLIDLDGDGVTDALRSGSRFECFFNDPQEGWKDMRLVERRDIAAFPNVSFADPRVKLADMSGDGLRDIMMIHDGNVAYWPNLGRGSWGRRVAMQNSPRFPHDYDPQRVLLGDVDGDGLADLVYVDHRSVTLWINQSGNGWSAPITIRGTPEVTNVVSVRLADMLGSGIRGVLWSAATDGQSYHMFFLDFTGGTKPYLLAEMDNHTGAITRVDYAPSTGFYMADQRDPATRWQTPLPFPVQVVARVVVRDVLSGGRLITEYIYHHGYWDGAEREFRGFGRVDQRDAELFQHDHTDDASSTTFAPPTETRTWFHLGPVGDAFGGWQEPDFSHEFWPSDPQQLTRPASMTELLRSLPRRDRRAALRALRSNPLRSELYALDGTDVHDRPYTVTEYLYGVREESAPVDGDTDRQRIFFPHTLAQRTTQWERGDDPQARFSFSDDYDDFGQPRRVTQIACPRGWRALADAPGQPFLATRSRTVYAQPVDPAVSIFDRVAQVTSYEIANDGSQAVLELRDLPDDSPALRIIGQTLNYYDGPAFEGLPFGEVGAHGAQVRGERLALTEEILRAAYKDGDNSHDLPPYLVPGGAPTWTDDYPQPFREAIGQLPDLVGYRFSPGDSARTRGYFVTTMRQRYDVQPDTNGDVQAAMGRGLVLATLDPLGRRTTIAYDRFDLLPIEVSDPAGMRTAATYDERVLHPRQVTDANGNRTRYAYTPLGLLRSIAVMGKEGETVGDSDETPGTRFEYDLRAFEDSSHDHDPRPVFVRIIRRVHHANDNDVPAETRDETIETREYSDGFGRLLQTRTQGEEVRFGDDVFGGGERVLPARQDDGAGGVVIGKENTNPEQPNVMISSWQIYDNKGRVVEKYEPFFSEGWNYAPPEERQLGQKATMFYDPRGQMIRTVNPNGSEQRVVFGVPHDLADPERFAPTPWETYTYDVNDNAGRTHPDESARYKHHWNTPASAVVDALGRHDRDGRTQRAGPAGRLAHDSLGLRSPWQPAGRDRSSGT